MASLKNDRLFGRSVEGSLNYYDNHKSVATAADKGLAARLSGHSYNILSNSDRDEVYFKDLRHDDHFLDRKGNHTAHWFGARKGKLPPDKNSRIKETLTHPDTHPRERALAQRRAELQLAQTENPNSFRGFRERCQSSFFPPDVPKRYCIDNKKLGNESEPLRPRTSDKATWQMRRGQGMSHSSSAPSLSLTAPAKSLEQAVRDDVRKEASQRQTESAHFAPVISNNTYSSSMDNTSKGQAFAARQRNLSLTRIENYDFAVSKKNNHFSQRDKLTREDGYFARPRLGVTHNSVKYDIVSNERKWFRY